MVVVEGKRYRRRIKGLRIDKVSSVDSPAMEGAKALLFKRADVRKVLPKPRDGETEDAFVSRFMSSDGAKEEFGKREQRLAVAMRRFRGARRVAKGHGLLAPVLTSAVDGHAHLVWLTGDRGGETSYATGDQAEGGHTHAWAIDDAGNITVAENDGHSHEVDQGSFVAAMREMLVELSDAPEAVVDVAFKRVPDGKDVDLSKITDQEIVRAVGEGTITCAAAELPYVEGGTFPVRTEADLLTAIELVGASSTEDQGRVARHVMKRALGLGLVGKLEDELAEVAKQAGYSAGANPETEDETMSDKNSGGGDDLKKRLDEALAKVEKLEKRAETAEKVADLPPEHAAHYKRLDDDKARAAFLAKDASAREVEVEDVRKGDPVVYKAADGTEFRKSAGEQTIRIARQHDELAKRLAESEAARSDEVLRKRAESELSALPGDVDVRVALLKAVDSIEDEKAREAATKALKAGNAAMAKSMRRVGTSVAPPVDIGGRAAAEAELEKRANELVAKSTDGVNYYEAYERVAMSDPDLYARAVGETAPLGQGA